MRQACQLCDRWHDEEKPCDELPGLAAPASDPRELEIARLQAKIARLERILSAASTPTERRLRQENAELREQLSKGGATFEIVFTGSTSSRVIFQRAGGLRPPIRLRS